MSKDKIVIKGARDNNLKNLSVIIPKNQLVVFTGVSGSGKSTLAFDTIYNEGQRRYVESLSSYARQFLGSVDKPDVDSIEGLSPAIAIDQKTTSNNPRSTVGTVTEIYDYYRLLYARIGVPYCPTHHEPIIAFSAAELTDLILGYPQRTRIQILAPVVHNEKGTHKDTLDKIRSQGFERLRINGERLRLSEHPNLALDKNLRHNLDIVIDRIVLKEDVRSRLYDAITLALDWGHGHIVIIFNEEEKLFSSHHTCKYCGFSVPKLEPRLFSFNAPLGYCQDCNGLGIKQEADPSLLVPHPELSLIQGAVEYYKNIVGTLNLEWQEFAYLCEQYQIPLDVPFQELTAEQKKIIMEGSPQNHVYVLKSSSGNLNHRHGHIEGIKEKVERLYRETTSDFMREYYRKFHIDRVCTTCQGARLNPLALAVLIDEKNIYQVTQLSVDDSLQFFEKLPDKLTHTQKEIARLVLQEIVHRLTFLHDVGLGYLTLERMAATLSGGEAQRIRLATQVGSKLSGVLYVLDEPSIGLHQRDNQRLIKTMKEMVALGNTLIVVEHDEEMMRSADHLVDIGPGAGIHGGEVVGQGTVADLIQAPLSLTGKYLAGEKFIPLPPKRLKGNGKYITLTGAKTNNLKNITVKIPLGTLTVITGVSGSGKSSLINETLFPGIEKELFDRKIVTGQYDKITGLENIDKVINISQDPIGRTPRSNPATYTKVFDEIRELFASTIEAKARGLSKSVFSFNIPGGRCEVCQGAGVQRIPMNFLPDVYVKCDACNGKRYHAETLFVTYKGKNIYDVLEMRIEEAYHFFENRPKIQRRIKTLVDVGLGYLKLGHPATNLSGGEAQRVKLANELQKRPTGKTLYILDEPTTGLHTDDIARLLDVLQSIVRHGDSVLVIEHNLDVIKVADYIIDLGPEGGDHGGEVVATGTPEEVAQNPKSYTGQYLKGELEKTKKYMKKSN
ncbi:MAG: excinuclease ABC subunit UvrA [Bacilli bacterium]|jgi:excinuclease ABC subunit A